jgi:MFS family permease
VRSVKAYLVGLNPNLPRSVWLLQSGGLANMFGNGLVVPFLIIYLHNVRGIALGIAGLVAASNAAAALVSGPIAGALADRIGARTTLVGALLVMAVAFSLFPLIETPWHAFALNSLAGIGSGAFWPSQGALLSGLTPPDRRHAAFALQRITMNLGVGLGALTGGLIATAGRPGSYTVLFLVDAVTFVVFAAVLTRVPTPRLTSVARVGGAGPAGGGFRAVLANRPFMAFLTLNTVVITASIVPSTELFPVFAKTQAGVTENGIGLIFFANTLFIVLAQLPIVRMAEGRRRMRALAAMGVLFAVTWSLVLAGGLWLEAGAATALFLLAFLVFALGQCLHGSVQGPLVADLAPPHLIGRYMALSASSWQVAFVVGPAAGGFILQESPFLLWPLAGALCLGAGAGALVLERWLPADVRRTPRPAPAATAGAPSVPAVAVPAARAGRRF